MSAAFFIPATPRSRPMNLVEALMDGQAPRWYQAETALGAIEYLRKGYMRPLVKLPTGAGKTKTSKLIVLSEELREVLGVKDGPLRVLFVSHKKRLNRQAAKEFKGHKSIEIILQSAFSAIPQSVLDKGWHVTCLDECHHEAMMSIQLLLDDLREHPIIGFTADDERPDGLLLKFDCTVSILSERMAAESGYIEKVGVNTILDYGKNNKFDLTKALLKSYHYHMGSTIIFMATNDECEQLGEFIRNELKLPCAVLGKGSTENEVDKALADLSAGVIKFILNCKIIGEGVDSPYVTDVILAREFKSKSEKKQFIGRAIRADSPCACWEFVNPLRKCVTAKEVVGKTKYERIMHIRNGQWVEKIIDGLDMTWGRMEEIRAEITDSPIYNVAKMEVVTVDVAVNDQSQALREVAAPQTPNEALSAQRFRKVLTLKRRDMAA